MTATAIVTGASSGLGLELALQLGEHFQIVGVSRHEPTDPRWHFTHVAGDASKRETATRAIEAAPSDITLLVNCAGVGLFGPAGTYDDETIARVLDANLVSTIVFCDALFPRFREQGGTIVNILSTAAQIGKPNESVYCAAKWGARGYSESLRAEAKGTRARVVSVFPGGMNTAFWPEPRETFMNPAEVATAIVAAILQPPTIAVSEISIVRP